jgi:organic hydroperoxide reductase OsmC/OhrA
VTIVKVHRYGVRAELAKGDRVTLSAPGKRDLDIALPPEFKNGAAGVWSPEELLIGSLASCFELMVTALAELRNVPLRSIRVDATGHVERRNHRYELILLELDVVVETEVGREHDIEHIAEMAREGCIVGSALDVPLRLEIDARAATAAGA